MRRRMAGVVACACVVLAMGCSGRRSQQYTEEGNTYLRLGDVAAAADSFSKALAADPGNAAAKLGQARCHAFRDEKAEAVAAYRAAVELDPELEPAYVEGAKLLLATGAADEAQALAGAYAAVDAERGGVLEASVLRESGKAEEAIAKLEALQARFAQSMTVRLGLARTYLAAREPAKAEEVLAAAADELGGDAQPARMLLIEAYQQQGKLPEMVAELRELVAQRPEDADLQLALARALLDSGEVEEAESIARPLLEATPESPWANYVVGSCLLEKGDFAGAAQCLQVAAHTLSDHAIVTRRLAAARRGGREPGEAAGVAAGPDGGAEAIAEDDWRHLWQSARLFELLEGRERYLSEGGEEVAETLTLAAVFIGNKALTEELVAEVPEASPVKAYVQALQDTDVRRLAEVLKGWNESSDERALLRENAAGFAYGAAGARARAMQAFSACVERWPGNGVALFNLASMYRRAGMPQFAARCIERLVATHRDNVEARLLLFRVLYDAGMKSEARRSAESTYVLFPEDRRALGNLAEGYRATGEDELAIEVLQRGVDSLPDAPEMRVALADALLRGGKTAEALEALGEEAFAGGAQVRAELVRAFAAAQGGDWAAAAERCEGLGPDAPLAARLLHTAALIRAGRAADAGALLLAEDGAAIAPMKTAVVLKALGKLPEGTGAPEPEMVQALAGNAEALGGFAYGLACQEMGLHRMAFEAFRNVDAEMPGQPLVAGAALATLAQATGMSDRGEAAADLAARYPDTPVTWLGVADVERALGHRDKEREALDKALALGPENGAVLMQRASFFEREQDNEGALETYRALLRVFPDNALMKNNLAYSILRVDGPPEEALGLAREAADELKANPHVLHTLGLAELRSGDLEQSEQSLRMALELRPGDPTLLLDFGQLLLAKGQEEEGRNQIESALRYADSLGLDFPRRAEAQQALLAPAGGAEQ